MKILIGDDHSIFRKGVVQLIKEHFPFSEITESGDAYDMYKRVIKEKFDIIISDISMPDRVGIDFISDYKNFQPKTPIIVVSYHLVEHYAIRTIRAGASGYITKESAGDELIKAINTVLTGRKYLSAEIAELLAENTISNNIPKQHELLSNREFEIFKLLVSGHKLSDIASSLQISMSAASTYKQRIHKKMLMPSVSGLVKYAIEKNLI